MKVHQLALSKLAYEASLLKKQFPKATILRTDIKLSDIDALIEILNYLFTKIDSLESQLYMLQQLKNDND